MSPSALPSIIRAKGSSGARVYPLYIAMSPSALPSTPRAKGSWWGQGASGCHRDVTACPGVPRVCQRDAMALSTLYASVIMCDSVTRGAWARMRSLNNVEPSPLTPSILSQ